MRARVAAAAARRACAHLCAFAPRRTAAGAAARAALSNSPQFDAALATLVAGIAQADQLLRTAAAHAPSADAVASLLSAGSTALEAAIGSVRAAWSAAATLPAVAAALAAVQQVLNEVLTAAAPALAVASPLVQAAVSRWHSLLHYATALPPAHSLAFALAALFFARGRAGEKKGPEPRLPLGPLHVAAAHARHSYAELAALAEALRFALVAAAPAGAMVPPAQRKEASAALAALVTDTEALLAALQRAQAAALAGGKPAPATASGATTRSTR